eukprot:TRINITY_DN7059_c0_g1_i12.p1 TRINITY_DN7059_c0_g1~~TRINITY_DN7059_c0_g1_i12.p1  ORF type:complete len:242 (-),score=-13.31 TRINITY_DN7059_c0_g1_i12:513-1238(-)
MHQIKYVPVYIHTKRVRWATQFQNVILNKQRNASNQSMMPLHVTLQYKLHQSQITRQNQCMHFARPTSYYAHTFSTCLQIQIPKITTVKHFNNKLNQICVLFVDAKRLTTHSMTKRYFSIAIVCNMNSFQETMFILGSYYEATTTIKFSKLHSGTVYEQSLESHLQAVSKILQNVQPRYPQATNQALICFDLPTQLFKKTKQDCVKFQLQLQFTKKGCCQQNWDLWQGLYIGTNSWETIHR